MKICIVTIYNGSNYGAFLQANAMRMVLESLGHQVCFLKTKARNPRRTNQKKILKNILALQWKKEVLQFQIDSGKVYEKAQASFAECELDSELWNQQDCILFGSDEIWNIRRKAIHQFPVFFGCGMKGKKKVAYAPSINLSERKDFEEHSYSLNALKEFQTITVRDGHSKQVLTDCLNRDDISVVLDPTMLLAKQDYERIAKARKLEPYILIYSYGKNLSAAIIREMQQYAKERSIKLVSVLNYFSWCDYNIPGNPDEILGLFQNAEAVFTDTFHGTVFSILFEKEFVIISKPTNKLSCLLENFQLSNRQPLGLINIEQILNQPISYVKCNQILEEQRKKSMEKLLAMIEA